MFESAPQNKLPQLASQSMICCPVKVVVHRASFEKDLFRDREHFHLNFCKIFYEIRYHHLEELKRRKNSHIERSFNAETTGLWWFRVVMGNIQSRCSLQKRKTQNRLHRKAVGETEVGRPGASKPSQLQRSASQGSLRRRYSDSGNYSYKTPWPVPLSDTVFLPEYDFKQVVKISDFEVCLHNSNN